MLTLLQSLMTLAAVALGWFLNEQSRKGRERRLAIGRALTTLLFFRRRMAGIKYLTQQLGQSVIPSSSQHEVQVFLDRVIPRLQGWEKEYHDAVSYLAGEQPMLAMRLRASAMRANFVLPNEWPTGPNAPAALSTIASHFIEPTTLDEPIRQLAKLHGRKVLASV